MRCSFHHWDGRCNVTSSPKPLRKLRNGIAPRHSSRLGVGFDMKCPIMNRKTSRSITTVASTGDPEDYSSLIYTDPIWYNGI